MSWIEAKRLFLERMRYQGRGKEFDARCNEEFESVRSSGESYSSVVRRMMAEYGFESLEREQELRNERTQKKQQDRGVIEKPIEDFGAAVAQLPAATPRGVSVYDWIAGHPAFSRETPGEDANLTAADVLYSDVGPAPSRAAVAALAQACYAPSLFWKEYWKVQSDVEKKIAAGRKVDDEEEQDEGIVDVERMLKEIKSRAKK